MAGDASFEGSLDLPDRFLRLFGRAMQAWVVGAMRALASTMVCSAPY